MVDRAAAVRGRELPHRSVAVAVSSHAVSDACT